MNVFDILGPVMIGPSSSHTAGAARIGGVARAVLAAEPVKAVIQLHGSFAKTYKGHGTDKAIIAGIMGMAPDDERIRRAPELAEAAADYRAEAKRRKHPILAAVLISLLPVIPMGIEAYGYEIR